MIYEEAFSFFFLQVFDKLCEFYPVDMVQPSGTIVDFVQF